MASDGSLWPLVQRPIAASFLVVALLFFLWPVWRDWRRRRLAAITT
jgi:TctA family transporter